MSRQIERKLEIEAIKEQARKDVAEGKNIRQHRYQYANASQYENEFRRETERLQNQTEQQAKATKIISLVQVETIEDLKNWIATYLL